MFKENADLTFRIKALAAIVLIASSGWYLTHRDFSQTPQLKFELINIFVQNNVVSHVIDFNELQESVKKLDEVDLNGVLYQAAESGASLNAMKWIVAKGAKPLKIRAMHELTFFEQVAKVPHMENFEYFIGLGLNPAERGHDGSTVLHYAAQGGLDPQMLTLLLSKGCKLTDQDELGRLPIHWANAKSINVLVSAGADVDAKDALGRTALMLAEKDNHNDIAQELIRNQASVFAKDEHGRTPLHYAAMSNNPGQLIDTLLAAGAAVTARDDDGYTAKELAVRSRDMFKNRSRGWYDKL